MCGIVGYWSQRDGAKVDIVEKMASGIASRGPDSFGAWVDASGQIALGHRRLSIVDLSPAGHQPMVSIDGRYTLTFNGEIYNHRELRAEIEKKAGVIDWRGHSDTETLLAAITIWGLEATLPLLNGMFAFACWDNRARALWLARDRMGEKPLYYGRVGGVFFFTSDLKALRPHPAWRSEVNRDALALYMRHNYVPDPWSIYKGISKLPPAHFVQIKGEGREGGEPVAYWSAAEAANRGLADPLCNESDVLDQLEANLREAVQSRMMADVPLGAFLSGGYDSSTVVALMQSMSHRPVKTFTIGFSEGAFDEAPHAKQVASHLGTDHTELYVRESDVLDVIPHLADVWSEPFADSSQLPTYLLSKLTRDHVTVSLSGDGGDELFCGYSRYSFSDLWSKLARIPKPIRSGLAWGAARAPLRSLDAVMTKLPGSLRVANFSDRLPKAARLLESRDALAFYRQLVSHWGMSEEIVLGAREPNTFAERSNGIRSDLGGIKEKMMLADMMTYLPGDILTKVDRASMAVSLEARVPLLDHRLVEFAWRIPIEIKMKNGQGKWPLRQILHRYVPQTLMERPKMGFGVPIEKWLSGALRDWAEDLLSERRLKNDGFLDPAPIRKKWEEHVSGRRRWHYYLWDVLMFQQWLQTNRT